MTRWFEFVTTEPLVENGRTGRLHRPHCWHVNAGRNPIDTYTWIEDGETLASTDAHLIPDLLCGTCCKGSDVLAQSRTYLS